MWGPKKKRELGFDETSKKEQANQGRFSNQNHNFKCFFFTMNQSGCVSVILLALLY